MSRTPSLSLVASVVAVVGSACSSGSGASGFQIAGDAGNAENGSSSGIVGEFGDAGAANDGALSAEAGCATASAQATRAPVYMLFVLDGSGSMVQERKWTAVVPALKSIFADMNKAADPGAGVGLIVFSDSQDKSNGRGPYPEPGIDVPVAFVGAAQLSSLNGRLSGIPVWRTPTQAAMTGAYGELEGFVPQTPLPPGGEKVMVLITDGVPTDACAPSAGSTYDYATNTCVEMAAAELTKASPEGPILTFVVGVGDFPSSNLTDFDPSFLGNMASAGGTGAKGCATNDTTTTSGLCYFEVDPSKASSASQLQMSFEAAINAIRGEVISCSFPLKDTGLGTIDPSKVNVEANGMTVPQSPTNGWSYDNPSMPTEIILNGTACSSLKTTPNAMVQIVLGCQTVLAM